MKEKNELPADIREMAKLAKVMSHPVRLYILQKLSKMNACCYSGDLVDELPVGRSTLSQHLKELKHSGLIQGEVKPPYIKYCLNQKKWEAGKALFYKLLDENKTLQESITMKILILCTGNSCRSQMAEAFLRNFDKRLEVYSAGTSPSAEVHPKAVQVMKEAGLDLSRHKPESVNTYTDKAFDYVITVCDDAKENCPVFTGNVKHRLHIGFEDPAEVQGEDDFIVSEFRRIRDEIKRDFYKLYEEEIKPEL
jgi:arsenate reductase